MPLREASRPHDHGAGADTAADLSGWPVRTLLDDRTVGRVHAALVDETGAPRYLDVRLDAGDRHVLIPVGFARVDHARRRVHLPGFARADLRDIPAYGHDADRITRAYETTVLAAYRAVLTGAADPSRGRHARGASARPHDRAGGTPGAPAPVEPLSRLGGVHIATDEADPRGWTVVAGDGRRIGTVDELLVDTRAMKVRYFVCALDEHVLGLEPNGRHVVVPSGYARLAVRERTVHVGSLESGDIAMLPAYTGERLAREMRAETDAEPAPEHASRGFYEQPPFDPARLFGGHGRTDDPNGTPPGRPTDGRRDIAS